jgi:hypothetical protein
VLDPDKLYTVGGLKLLDAKRISVHNHGWLVFQVKKAVEEWVNGSSQNNGQYYMVIKILGKTFCFIKILLQDFIVGTPYYAFI